MPDYFTHDMIADKILASLSEGDRAKITDVTMFKLGSQGGDMFFFYDIFHGNMGSALHKASLEDTYAVLFELEPSYAAGYAAHRAMDDTVHPEIYANQDTARGHFKHIKFEADLGLYVSRKFGMERTTLTKKELYAKREKIEKVAETFERMLGKKHSRRKIRRDIWGFLMYMRVFKRYRKKKYRCRYDFSLMDAKVDEGLANAKAAAERILHEDK